MNEGYLNHKQFKANQWFTKEPTEKDANSKYVSTGGHKSVSFPIFPVFKNLEEANAKHGQDNSSINKYFTPGWKGESLTSKDVKKFVKILNTLHVDAKDCFLQMTGLNKKLKSSLFDEFLSFAECKAINCTNLDDYNSFWNELRNANSPYRAQLDQFIEIYTFRIAVIFILKIRFISVLLRKTQQKFTIKNLIYPNSYLTSVFQQGSSRELKTKAIEQNIFSWYKPSEQTHDELIGIYEISDELSITEIIKNISLHSERILAEQTHYSHALSHKNFGLFLNSLLINFPLWLNNFNHRFNSPYRLNKDGMEVISCKFDGSFLESLSLSHWLAQENNKHMKWEQILCPDFKGADFETGLYIKIVNELQFLTFLAQIANQQGQDCVDFVAKVVNGHLHNRKTSSTEQKNLLFNDISQNHSTYDRIILNVTEAPKNNVQHYLINQIQQNTNDLKENGLIYLISNKKLFVPSQKSKIDGLLKSFKLEGIFDLENIQGKGEVGSYIYIFSKIKTSSIEDFLNKKQTCFNFRMHGQLDTFQYFSYLTHMVQNFFFANLTDVPPMYHKEMSNFQLEFFQDAIVDGRLINSTNKDSSKITHPQFFNNLMKSCHPFDFYFDIQNINLGHDYHSKDHNLSLSVENSTAYSPFIAIVDARAKDKSVKIKIINSQALEATVYEYGQSMCSYFEINPKWNNININIVKDFLESPIGLQLIDLTFNNELTKAKSNLAKLLLPRFLVGHQNIPEHIDAGLKLFKLDSKEILTKHPTQLDKDFKNIEKLIYDLAKHYPEAVCGYLANFKRSIQKCIDLFGISKTKSIINFSNPVLKSPLLLSKTYPIYPHNNDIFIDFSNVNLVKLIHLPLDNIQMKTVDRDGITNYTLELYGQGQLVLTIYSDIEMIKFLEFILTNAYSMPISKILQAIQVPALEDLKNIMQSFDSMKRVLIEFSEKIPPVFERILAQSITQN
jgi:hypothetical protein